MALRRALPLHWDTARRFIFSCHQGDMLRTHASKTLDPLLFIVTDDVHEQYDLAKRFLFAGSTRMVLYRTLVSTGNFFPPIHISEYSSTFIDATPSTAFGESAGSVPAHVCALRPAFRWAWLRQLAAAARREHGKGKDRVPDHVRH